MQPDPYAQSNRKLRNALIAAAIAAALVLGFGIGASGLVNRSQSPPPIVTQRQADVPAPILEKRGESGPAVTPLEKATMPADVLAYLEHLERIEKRRRQLATNQVSDLLVTMASLQGLGAYQSILDDLLNPSEEGAEPPTPAQELGSQAEKKKAEWNQLKADFEAVPPPTVCIPLKSLYTQTLGETGTMMGEILGTLENASADPQAAVRALMNLRGDSATRIDAAARGSNTELNAIFRRYETRPWFQIEVESDSGILNQFGGMPALPAMPPGFAEPPSGAR